MLYSDSEPNAVLYISWDADNPFRQKLSKGNEIHINNKYYTAILQIYDYKEIPLNQKFDACILHNTIPEKLPDCEIKLLAFDNEKYIEGWEYINPAEDIQRVFEALEAHRWQIMDEKLPLDFSLDEMLGWRIQASEMCDSERRKFISDKMANFENFFE
eukprot:NODE_387_length_8274_cov_0.737125.p5 type:complete len:158 gc:universal NODE_387_length_8274_cov_0.737125:4405-4878(+)